MTINNPLESPSQTKEFANLNSGDLSFSQISPTNSTEDFSKNLSRNFSTETTLLSKPTDAVDADLAKTHAQINDLNQQAWDLRDSDVLEARKKTKEVAAFLEDLEKQDIPYYQGTAEHLKVLAFLTFRQREFEEALTTAFKALRIYTQLGHTTELAKIFSIIAIIYIELGDFVNAYTYLLKQLNFAEEFDDPINAACAAHDIGLLYESHTEDTTLALSYFNQAQKQFEELDSAWGICITKVSKSALYTKMGQYETALSLAKEALAFGTKNEHDTAKCYAYCRLGCVHAALDNRTKAISYLNQALILSRQLSYDEISAEALFTKAQLFLSSKETETARVLFNEAIKASKTVHDDSLLRKCYVGISESYKLDNDFNMALATYESYITAFEQEKHVENKRKLRNIELIKTMETLRQDAEVTKTQNVALVEKVDELNKLQQELYHLSTRDALTKLYNRRYATEQISIIFNRAKRHGFPLSVALLDLDHFKSINDTFSHLIGDEVLKAVAKILSDTTREIDIAARYGGEEFLLILPNTDIDGAVLVCERIRVRIESYDWQSIATDLKVTTSIGIAHGADRKNADELIALADKYLYESKADGRNTLTS